MAAHRSIGGFHPSTGWIQAPLPSLSPLQVPSELTQLKGIFNLVWSRSVPLKVAALAWRALHDRLPKKCNLARRNVIKDRRETICSRCLENEENS
ncbi:hypothetical protein SLA2020_501050 [Shorea laevis]